jgi:hypothetical protein
MKYPTNPPTRELITQTGTMTPNKILIYPASNYFNTKLPTATVPRMIRHVERKNLWKQQSTCTPYSFIHHPATGRGPKKRPQYHPNAK